MSTFLQCSFLSPTVSSCIDWQPKKWSDAVCWQSIFLPIRPLVDPFSGCLLGASNQVLRRQFLGSLSLVFPRLLLFQLHVMELISCHLISFEFANIIMCWEFERLMWGRDNRFPSYRSSLAPRWNRTMKGHQPANYPGLRVKLEWGVWSFLLSW